MPFKSDAQRRKFYAMEDRGEISKATLDKWERETPKGKDLPERVGKKDKKEKKSAAYELGQAVALNKQAGPMAWVGRKAVMPLLAGGAKPVSRLLRMLGWKPMRRAGVGVGKYRKGLLGAIGGTDVDSRRLQRIYGGVGTAAVGIPALAGLLGGISGGRRRKAERELEAALAAKEGQAKKADLLGPILIGGGAGLLLKKQILRAKELEAKRKGQEAKKKPKKKSKKEAQLGTPFMDGFLLHCAKQGLNQKQVADVLEKAAEKDDRMGKECKAFLDRLAASEE